LQPPAILVHWALDDKGNDMRFGDQRESGNYTDDTGRGGMGFGGGGGNALGCLLPMIMSRFGLGGVVVLLLGYFLLSSLGVMGGGGSGLSPTSQSAPAGKSSLDPNTKHFTLQVLGSTEDTWGKLLGGRYQPTNLVYYSEGDQSGCGFAQSAMGPFYCPTDKKIYLDAQFFNELSTRFQAPGDFAMAYVIAHEVGHHVQKLIGVTEKTEAMRRRMSETDYNKVSVRVELQADCFAGVWGHPLAAGQSPLKLDPGDVDEALRAATAIGDDTLQKQARGSVVPDSFTHGSSAQRVTWFKRGMDSGDIRQCDTFKAGST
jgi:hypothetical protein